MRPAALITLIAVLLASGCGEVSTSEYVRALTSPASCPARMAEVQAQSNCATAGLACDYVDDAKSPGACEVQHCFCAPAEGATSAPGVATWECYAHCE